MRLAVVLATLFAMTAALSTGPALALNDYLKPTHLRLANSLVRLGAVDLQDDLALDEYAHIAHCDIVETHFGNEFIWREIRTAMRESVELKKREFPLQYYVIAYAQLQPYDFKHGGFRISFGGGDDEPPIRVMSLIDEPLMNCKHQRTRFMHFTPEIHAILRKPILLRLLPMPEADAIALREFMLNTGNSDRTVTVRFNLSLVAMRDNVDGGRNVRYISTHPDSVEIFADRDMTERLHVYIGDAQRQFDLPVLSPDG